MCAMADLVQPSPEQLEAFLRVAADALRVPPDVMIDVFGASLDPGDCRVVVEDGRPVAGAYSLPALQSFGGRLVSCSAVSCVAVAPDRRGGGRASTLMAGLLALMHERAHVVSTLHPANLALYRRAGYEAAARELHATVRLHELPIAGVPGTTVDEIPVGTAREQLDAVHRHWALQVPGTLVRADGLWNLLLAADKTPPRVAVARTDGRIRGYVVLTRKHDEDPIGVRDLVALDRDAALALLAYLGGLRTIWDCADLRIAGFDSFTHLLREQPEKVRSEAVMVRLVDVPGALEARGYPDGLQTRFDVTVRDDVLAHNAGTWEVEIQAGRAVVRRGREGGVALGVGALAALYTGHATPVGLATAGALRGSDADLRALAAAFAGPPPVVNEAF